LFSLKQIATAVKTTDAEAIGCLKCSYGPLKHKRFSRIYRFWTYRTLYLGNGARQEL